MLLLLFASELRYYKQQVNLIAWLLTCKLYKIELKVQFMTLGRFSEVHEFEKPNDEQALNLMNSCAVAVLNEFQDITFSYGVSDEYRF